MSAARTDIIYTVDFTSHTHGPVLVGIRLANIYIAAYGQHKP